MTRVEFEQSSDAREWVRLVALRHDLILWRPDTRAIRGRYSVPYLGQGWLKDVLEHVPLPLTGNLFLESMDVAHVQVVRASGVWEVRKANARARRSLGRPRVPAPALSPASASFFVGSAAHPER